MTYRDRVVDRELKQRLSSAGAVLIEGPKFCGKTETARQHCGSAVYLDTDQDARAALSLEPSLVLDGGAPRLIDEWQVEPSVWNHVRRRVDDLAKAGQFILTGSAVPADDITRHTGAGRFSRLRMRPMSLFESGHSTGAISLADLLAGDTPRSEKPGLGFRQLVDQLAVGGWPALQDRAVRDALQTNRDYLDQVRRFDVERVDGVRRDPEKVGRLMQSLARSVASEVSVSTLASDVGGADGPISRNTVSSYLDALERLMVIEKQEAWATHLRSKAILRTSAKRHFADPSLAVAALRATPDRLLRDLNLLGLLFESLVVRDLSVYAQPQGGQIRHYRDNNGLEVDAVVETDQGQWAAFEVKLSTDSVEKAAASLLKFAKVIDLTRCGQPAALAVITATGYGYRRPDGVCVLPIGALGP
jgi:predicted AAA+ superfamily ATPase